MQVARWHGQNLSDTNLLVASLFDELATASSDSAYIEDGTKDREVVISGKLHQRAQKVKAQMSIEYAQQAGGSVEPSKIHLGTLTL